MNTLRGTLAGLAIALNTAVWCVPLYLLGLIRLPCTGRARRALARWMDATVQLWVAGNRAIFALLGLVRVRARWVNDADLSLDRWYLVVSNHQSWADILILQNTLRGRIPMLKFFTKRELVWVPLAGVAMVLLGFPYVRRLSPAQLEANPALEGADRQATLDACRGFLDHPVTVLSFLEGSRFTPTKQAAQDGRFRHLLNPKLGGVSYVVDTLKSRIHKVLDITLIYRDDVPTFWELLQGRCREVEVVIEARDLPDDITAAADAAETRERLRPWVESLWQAKDRRLSRLDGLAN